MNTILRSMILSAAICQLGACATHKMAAEQAKHGVGLMAKLELELIDFRRRVAVGEQEQRHSLADQRNALENMQKIATADIRARKSAGDVDTVKMLDKLIDDADALYTHDAELSDERLESLLLPLPSTSAAVLDTQTQLTEIGEKLPLKTKTSEFLTFSKAIKKNIKTNKNKMKAAESKTPPTKGE